VPWPRIAAGARGRPLPRTKLARVRRALTALYWQYKTYHPADGRFTVRRTATGGADTVRRAPLTVRGAGPASITVTLGHG
jgi:hypothetical protein